MLIACFGMHLTTKKHGGDIAWSIGSLSGGPYGDNTNYTERYCLAPGEYTLTCRNQVARGWFGGFLEIQGHKYCQDFLEYTAMRKITILGIDMNFKFYLK